MELELLRAYFPDGTNGDLMYEGQLLCFTIELPWKNNYHKFSCIPEGRYPLKIRFTKALGWHIAVKDVEDRIGILMHIANDALKELKGCIAPVSAHTGHGKGRGSKIALNKILKLMLQLEESETVYLIIKKK